MSTIERKHTNRRMSQIVVHGNTVYLAGQVGEPRHDVADQTRDALARVEPCLSRRVRPGNTCCKPPSGSPTWPISKR